MKRQVLICLGFWTLSAMAVWAQKPLEFCAQVDVLTDPVKSPTTGPISVRHVLDLYFDVNLSGDVTGEHVLELKLRTPKGHDYQTLAVPITTVGADRGMEREVATYPRPLRVQVLELNEVGDGPSSYKTQLSLPIAGTPIINSALYGQWAIDVYLDGQIMSCDGINGFTLTQ